MSETRRGEIWILGATGRVGRAVAERLTRQDATPVTLLGRSAERLVDVAASVGEARTIVAPSPEAMTDAIRRERPTVVVNLLGGYAKTAPEIARTCMPNGHYVDLANDLTAMSALLDLGQEAADSHSTIITGAGFGVLATEAVVVALCAGRPTPSRVRVDALASFASEDGVMGEAFAETSLDVITAGGRRYVDGQLVPVRLASNLTRHSLPDGTTIASAAVPSGELLAAYRVSKAPSVDFTSALAPTAPMMRILLPLMSRLLTIPAMRRTIVRRMARSKTTAAPRPRPHSWGHAIVEWPDGIHREGWLRADDALDYTADVLATVARTLSRDEASRGAFTPAAAFGATIAEDAGGQLILDAP